MSKNCSQSLETGFTNLSLNDDNKPTTISNNNITNIDITAVEGGDEIQSLRRSKYNISNAYNSIPKNFNLIQECSSFHPLENIMLAPSTTTVHPYALDLSDSQDDLQHIKQKNKDQDLDVLINNLNLSSNSVTQRQRSMPYCI